MKAQNRYSTTADLVRDILQDEELARQLEEQKQRTRIGPTLAGIRSAHQTTQAELAKRLSCTQSCLSKLETSRDDLIKHIDIVKYMRGLGYDAEMLFYPAKSKCVSKVRFHASRIESLLHNLATLAADDGAIQNGVHRFMDDLGRDLMSMLQKVRERLAQMASEEETPESLVLPTHTTELKPVNAAG